jgi:hypothetical protein
VEHAEVTGDFMERYASDMASRQQRRQAQLAAKEVEDTRFFKTLASSAGDQQQQWTRVREQQRLRADMLAERKRISEAAELAECVQPTPSRKSQALVSKVVAAHGADIILRSEKFVAERERKKQERRGELACLSPTQHSDGTG